MHPSYSCGSNREMATIPVHVDGVHSPRTVHRRGDGCLGPRGNTATTALVPVISHKHPQKSKREPTMTKAQHAHLPPPPPLSLPRVARGLSSFQWQVFQKTPCASLEDGGIGSNDSRCTRPRYAPGELGGGQGACHQHIHAAVHVHVRSKHAGATLYSRVHVPLEELRGVAQGQGVGVPAMQGTGTPHIERS